MTHARDRAIGAACGMTAYLAWGFVALYFGIITDRGVRPLELLAHRVVWSVAFCLLIVVILRRYRDLWQVMRHRRRLAALTLSSVLVAINWLAFIYAVDTRQLTEASLGYFILPLVSIVLGLAFLHERLDRLQWLCVMLAGVGVCMIVYANGHVPWIAIAVSLSFGFYGLVRKLTPVGPIVGLAVETAVLSPIALIYLLLHSSEHALIPGTYLLLILAGAITAVLLMLYARAAQTLKLSTLGFMQYIAPTCQLLVAIYVRPEAVSGYALIGFVPIWLALAIFSVHAAFVSRRESRSAMMLRLGADSSMVRARDS